MACIYLRGGAKFIATDEEPFIVVGAGRKMPSTGALVDSLMLSLDDSNGN